MLARRRPFECQLSSVRLALNFISFTWANFLNFIMYSHMKEEAATFPQAGRKLIYLSFQLLMFPGHLKICVEGWAGHYPLREYLD